MSLYAAMVISALAARADAISPEAMPEKTHWRGQATVKIETDGHIIYYVDPGNDGCV
jgi:hypothetical protein